MIFLFGEIQQDRLAAVEESVKEMNSMLNGADDTAILTALISQVHIEVIMRIEDALITTR